MARKSKKTTSKSKSVDSAIHDDIQNGKIEAAMASITTGLTEAIKAAPKPAPKPKAAPKPKPAPRTLRRGMQGDDVKKMQKAIGVTPDGDFGFGTLVALKKWQNVNGLKADGIAGPVTQSKM